MKPFKPIYILLFALSITLGGNAQKKEPIKVACIGNSITAGYGIKDKLKNAYPAQLERMLGKDYEIKNFGVSGRTLLSKGNAPYIKTNAYKEALSYSPHIVIIKLGTNDSKPFNWPNRDDFKVDYQNLIKSFQDLESKPTIYLCLAVPVFKSEGRINDKIVANEINPLIKEIAQEQNLELIDLYTPLLGRGDLFPDSIHPNEKGAAEMAEYIYKVVAGKMEKTKFTDKPR